MQVHSKTRTRNRLQLRDEKREHKPHSDAWEPWFTCLFQAQNGTRTPYFKGECRHFGSGKCQLYIIIGGIATCKNKHLIPAYIVLIILDIMIYGNYLFKLKPNWQFLSAINFCTYCFCVFHILRPLTTSTEKISENEIVNSTQTV